MKTLLLFVTHSGTLILGFMLGIYILPILIQPKAPELSQLEQQMSQVIATGMFDKNRQDSDFLHWGEGELSLTETHVMFIGELAPGPDYKLYLSPTYVETEADFKRLKASMLSIGDIKTFDRFSLDLPVELSLADYQAAIIWCESFGQFISSAKLTVKAQALYPLPS